MATEQQISAAQILQVLESLGIVPKTPGRVDKKYAKDVLDDYMKYNQPSFVEVYDPYTRRYMNNEKMIDAFTRIESEGIVPEQIENDFAAQDIILSPTESQDLKDYYSMVKKRDEAIAERRFDFSGAAAESGLPDPFAKMEVPNDVVQQIFRPKFQGKPVTQVYEELAEQAMRDWESSDAYKNPRMQTVGYEPTTNIKFEDDPVGSAFNSFIDWTNDIAEETQRGSLSKVFGRQLFGGLPSSWKVKGTKRIEEPAFDPRRYYAEEMAKMAANERVKDWMVRSTLNDTLKQKYGSSPYEMQLKTLASQLGL